MRAYDYFQSYRDYFWQWEEGTDILAIPQGNTIAYRQFVADVLQKLQPQGLPPFGSLLLAIIATNPGGNDGVNTVYALLCRTLKTSDNALLAHGVEFMKMLSEVPAEFKRGNKRLLLLQALFQDSHNRLSSHMAGGIVSDFVTQAFNAERSAAKKDFDEKQFSRDFKTLVLLKNKLGSVEELLARVTALPAFAMELPEPEELPEAGEAKDLAEALTAHPKTFHVGALIRRIWSGLNIPIHSALPSQQPLGGVSDLTNKGDLDKLLISEYANDDLVFLSRLANGEALYIHREVPPVNNNLERVVLIDVSLKSWGTPKAVSFATMLAIAKHPKTDIACSAYAIGNSFYPVGIGSVEEVIDGLQLLDTGLDPSQGLTDFFKQHPAGKNREVFLLTGPGALKEPAMVKALMEHHRQISYWIFTDALGNIDVYRRQQTSKKHIQHLQLPLGELWKKEPEANEEPGRGDPGDAQYPLLFRRALHVKAILYTPDEQTFIVTGDKALLRFHDSLQKPYAGGWEMIMEKIPAAYSEFELGLLHTGEHLLLLFNPHSRELSLVNLHSREKKSFEFREWRSTAWSSFLFYGQVFYHLNNKGCWAIGWNGIEAVERMPEGLSREAFDKRAEEMKKRLFTFPAGHTMFKNVKEAFINEKGRLVLNKHELLVNSGWHLKLDVTASVIQKEAGQRQEDNSFAFAEGSTIGINRVGLLILKSSNRALPTVYIPSILDSALAAATEADFAGNDFYYQQQQFSVRLLNAGANRLSVIRCVKEFSGLGLADVNGMVESAPCRVINHVSYAKAESIKALLEEAGAEAEIGPSRPGIRQLEKITVPVFYAKFIQPFIDQILNHGA